MLSHRNESIKEYAKTIELSLNEIKPDKETLN